MRKLFRAAAAAAALLVAGGLAVPGGAALASGVCQPSPATVTVRDGYGRPVVGARLTIIQVGVCPAGATGVVRKTDPAPQPWPQVEPPTSPDDGSGLPAVRGVTGSGGVWSGRVGLYSDPAIDFMPGYYLGAYVSATVRSAGGAAEQAVCAVSSPPGILGDQQQATSLGVAVEPPHDLALTEVLPVIEGPATLRVGQAATYRIVAPTTTWSKLQAAGNPLGPSPNELPYRTGDRGVYGPADCGLVLTTLYVNGSEVPYTAPVHWSAAPLLRLDGLQHAGAGAVAVYGDGGLEVTVRAVSPGHAWIQAEITPNGQVAGAAVRLPIAVLPSTPPSIALDGPRELVVGSRGGYVARPAHATGPVSWSIDGRDYGRLTPEGLRAVLAAQKPGYVTITATAPGEGGQVAKASLRVRIVAPPGPPLWALLLPLLLILILLLLFLAARRRRKRAEEDERQGEDRQP